jgi:hypothetical protein
MSRITQKGHGLGLSIVANGAFQTSTDSSLGTLVGTRWDLSDGREVILVQASSATTVAAGKLYQDAAVVPNHQNLAITAIQTYSANGNLPYQITATLGNTAITANQYRGGFVVVNAGTGLGQTLRIASHPAANALASVVLTLEESPATALATSDTKVCLQPAHGANVIINPTTVTGAQVGVGLYAIAASSYGFLVSKGLTSGLADGAIGVGLGISPSGSVAGAFVVAAATTSRLGFASQAGVDTEYRTVFVNL